ncbi:MAG: tetratricopeptide repeat protein [Armatimonadetes bacterium]|nr:tetratricopeptide repeat protein [Armatimonadota bacterium]
MLESLPSAAMRTISCEKCETSNTVDSKFCRACGHALPEDAAELLRQENVKLLEDGRRLLADHRLDEAKLVADSILESDPNNVDALALHGDVFEREGKIDEALATYERVVELRPDSAIDRIRVTHLRKVAALQELEVEEPRDSRRTLTMIALAGVVLLTLGSAAFLSFPPVTSTTVATNTTQGTEVTGFRSYSPALVPNVSGNEGTATTTNPNTATSNPGAATAASGSEPVRGGFRLPNSAGYTGPLRTESESQVPPFNPPVNITPNQPSQTSQPNPPSNQAPEQPAASGGSEEPQENPGVIEISQSNSGGAASQGSGGGSAESLIQQARNLYLQEDYAGAAAAYEKAIQAGGGTGATYQRLAQCYEKLGRRADAISAYRKAINAFEAQVQRGQGSSRIRTAIDACKRAIAALGG